MEKKIISIIKTFVDERISFCTTLLEFAPNDNYSKETEDCLIKLTAISKELSDNESLCLSSELWLAEFVHKMIKTNKEQQYAVGEVLSKEDDEEIQKMQARLIQDENLFKFILANL